MNYRFSLLFVLSFLIQFTTAQTEPKKSFNIKRTNEAPKIDGVLDDLAWQDAEEITDFIQFRPEMGVTLPEHQKTIVKMAYDDNAVYVGAYLKDDPDKIQRQFTSRDNFGNNDFFLVVFNPNNDGQTDTEFFVFPSGTQADAVANPNSGEDFGWNAVWDSEVKIVDDGWIVEMKIPYRALRFSKDVKTWGIQFHRRFRIDNTQYTWNPIDRTKGNIGLYHGEMTGIENIEPPTRLIFFPFLSTVYRTTAKPEYNLGADLKFGITENFTLDATLIPDFSQAGFDNLVLNLGPFEQTFSEQRQFFTEGVDIFSKGNLFFSRRIGGAPSGFPELSDGEEITDFPNVVKVLNAMKVSGRTKKGLGIGFFNAITEETEATIRNTLTDEVRKEVVEPLANYNILVLDQNFNGNSSVSLVNTNVMRSGSFRDANVTALVANISNKRNTYNIRGDVKMSNRYLTDGTETGFSSFVLVRKAHGNWRYSIDHRFADDNYDINDMGLNFRNNFNNFGIDINYRIFEPWEKLNNFFINAYVNYRNLADPGTFTGSNFGVFVNGQTKKLMWFGANANFEPGKQYDYFEPRDFENRRFWIYKNIGSINGWLDTDSNRTLSFNVGGGTFHAFDEERDLFGYFFNVSPTVIVSEKFRINYSYDYQNNKGSRGYANFSNDLEDEIVFGERDIVSVENSLGATYNFNPFQTLAITFRNFWTTVDYDRNPYYLQEDGSLIEQSQTFEELGLGNSNQNFNTWNLDLNYTWQVAPGSFLTALYRNQLFSSSDASQSSYFDSLKTLFDQSMDHTFSLRLTYFIDYNNVKNIFKRKNNALSNNPTQASRAMRRAMYNQNLTGIEPYFR